MPVGERMALVVPAGAVTRRSGLDFVTIATPQGPRDMAVVIGSPVVLDGMAGLEVLTGLRAGDRVVVP